MPDQVRSGKPAGAPWLRWPRLRPGARWRLFCIPHAGSGPAPYLPWAAALGEDIELVAVCLPGRERRLGEPRHRRMAPLIADLSAALAPELRPPYALFGHSLGALVAFALCLALEGQDAVPAPAHLFVSGCRAPQARTAGRPLHALDGAAFLARVREFDGLPSAVLHDRQLLALLLPVLRDDFELAETYRPTPGQAVRAPMTAIGGTRDNSVPPTALKAWQQHALGQFATRTFPGGHFYLTEHPQQVIDTIRAGVAGAPPPPPGEP